MRSLTKKLLFFFILSMMCNSILSDEDCLNNVHRAFHEYSSPEVTFVIALTAYSEELLKSNKVIDLHGYFEGNKTYINNTIHQKFVQKHKKVMEYMISLLDWINQNIEPAMRIPEMIDPEILKKEVFGYFKFLLGGFNEFDTYSDKYVTPPIAFCEKNENPECNDALMIMFKPKDGPLEVEDYYNFRGIHALRHVYLNYSYVDFTPKKLIPVPDRTVIDQDQINHNILLTNIMAHYFIRVLSETEDMINAVLGEIGPQYFPTIEDYCRLPKEYRN